MQKQRRPEYPILTSVQGFQFCDLLLSQEKHQEVKERAARTIEIAKSSHWLLEIALDNLSLGRAWLLQSRQTGASDYGQAVEFLQQAVDGLRQAGQINHLPRGLLARAELRRVSGDYQRAGTDLDEAQRLAERSQMGLHLADCHLERARLCLAQLYGTGSVSDLSLGNAPDDEDDEAAGRSRSPFRTELLAQARAHWTKAKAMIEQMGYHRRDGELKEIEKQLG